MKDRGAPARLGPGGRLAAGLLSFLAGIWPSPLAGHERRFGAAAGSEAYAEQYALDQFMRRVRYGLGLGEDLPPLWGRTVLEVGCGHGGITCYFASIGALPTVGVDLDLGLVGYGRRLRARIEGESGRPLPARFVVSDCARLAMRTESVDAVLADNFFEHASDPRAVISELHRVLKPGGLLLVPVFSSIHSKYGPHLKHGLRLPWLNLVFSTPVILAALRARAERRPELWDFYPGLRDDPRELRDVRRHRDLNEITHHAFLDFGRGAGFQVVRFWVHGTRLGRVVQRLWPAAARTGLLEVLSTGAGAVLEKPCSGGGRVGS